MCRVHSLPPATPTEIEHASERLMAMLNQGALSLMVSIGHRTGLFDALAERGASTVDELATHAGLELRYVREWLGAVTTGGLVSYDPVAGRFRLPAAHAAVLTRAAAPDNLAVVAQYIGVLGQVEDRVVDCFREGGGVDYAHYPRFHEVMAEDSGQTVLGALATHILPLLGDQVLAGLERGIAVLDIGCGRGRALAQLARRFPQSQFVGYDLSARAIANATESARAAGLSNLHFEARDLTHFDREAEPDAFALVFAFDAIHDQAAPGAVLRGVRRTLAPGGTFLMQDIRASSHLEHNLDHPIAPLLYTISTMHCMTVSLAQGGEGLGTMWGRERALELLGQAGFEDVAVHELEHDPMNDFYLARA